MTAMNVSNGGGGCSGGSFAGDCRWLDGGLQSLLDDPEGVQLLKQFMDHAWPGQARAFDFYFAVRGLRAKQTQGYSARRCRRVVLAIERRYIRREELLPISAAARQAIQERIRAGDDSDVAAFDSAFEEVAQFLAHRVYPGFARWWGGGSGFELATSAAAAAAAAAVVASGAAGIGGAPPRVRASSVPRSHSCHSAGGGSLDLTSRNLMATVRERGAAATAADCVGLSRTGPALPYYYVPASFFAASLPDSLPQTTSLSSDAQTDDTQSLLTTDTGSSLDAVRAAVAGRQRKRAAASATAAAAVPSAFAGNPGGGGNLLASCDSAANPHEFARLLAEKLQRLLVAPPPQSAEAAAAGVPEGATPSAEAAAVAPAATASADASTSAGGPACQRTSAADVLKEPWAQRIIGRVLSNSDTPEQILDRHVHEVLDQRVGGAPHSMSDPNLLVYHHHHHHHILPRGGGAPSGRSGKRNCSGGGAFAGSGSVGSSIGGAASSFSAAAGAAVTAPSIVDSGFGGTVSSRSRCGMSASVSASAAMASANAAPGRQLNERVALQCAPAGLPRQPLASDLNMPVIDRPHTDNVIEEARRRLQQFQMAPLQTQPQQQQLIIGYFFCGDSVPFRHAWPQAEISLGQFRQLLPKRGAYRFFFKKRSDEFFAGGAVFEEVTNDCERLPLWDGKVVGKVEKIE